MIKGEGLHFIFIKATQNKKTWPEQQTTPSLDREIFVNEYGASMYATLTHEHTRRTAGPERKTN